jgi:hypothetical protein
MNAALLMPDADAHASILSSNSGEKPTVMICFFPLITPFGDGFTVSFAFDTKLSN